MKKLLALILIIQSLSVFGQKIFKDENDKIISEEIYNNRKLIQGEFKACNDSLQICKIIINRSEEGSLESEKILTDLQNLLNIKLEKNQPTIITFHPGKDYCNSSGASTVTSQYLWHKEKEELLDKIKNQIFCMSIKIIQI